VTARIPSRVPRVYLDERFDSNDSVSHTRE
jgi:hypothetical protein